MIRFRDKGGRRIKFFLNKKIYDNEAYNKPSQNKVIHCILITLYNRIKLLILFEKYQGPSFINNKCSVKCI